jgi:hypothetical protein
MDKTRLVEFFDQVGLLLIPNRFIGWVRNITERFGINSYNDQNPDLLITSLIHALNKNRQVETSKDKREP